MINILASTVIGTIVSRILLSLGLGFITYTGFDTVLTQIKQYLFSSFDSLPENTVLLMGLLGIDQFISLMFSAWTTVFMLKTLKSLGWFS